MPPLAVAPPKQFGGPGDPLVTRGSADGGSGQLFCAIARGSKFEWQSIECESPGELTKVDRKMCFTCIINRVKLMVGSDSDQDKAGRLKRAVSVVIRSPQNLFWNLKLLLIADNKT